jgi:hypothetical protein
MKHAAIGKMTELRQPEIKTQDLRQLRLGFATAFNKNGHPDLNLG